MTRARAGVVAALMACVPIVLGAQGLADAAKRAEQQRKEAEGKPKIRITYEVEKFYEVPLTPPRIAMYTQVRSGLANLWKRDHPLYERVRDGFNAAELLRDFRKVLEGEPLVVDALKFYEYSPEDLVTMELTIRRAHQRANGAPPDRNDKVEQDNTAYMRVHETPMAYTMRSWDLKDGGLSIWPTWLAR